EPADALARPGCSQCDCSGFDGPADGVYCMACGHARDAHHSAPRAATDPAEPVATAPLPEEITGDQSDQPSPPTAVTAASAAGGMAEDDAGAEETARLSGEVAGAALAGPPQSDPDTPTADAPQEPEPSSDAQQDPPPVEPGAEILASPIADQPEQPGPAQPEASQKEAASTATPGQTRPPFRDQFTSISEPPSRSRLQSWNMVAGLVAIALLLLVVAAALARTRGGSSDAATQPSTTSA